MIKRSVIPAAGLGTGLSCEERGVVKPLIKVNNIPMIEYCLSAMKLAGIKEFVFVTMSKNSSPILYGKLEEYLREKHSDLFFHFVEQDLKNDISGWAHALWLARKYIDDPVFVMFPDNIYYPKEGIKKFLDSYDGHSILVGYTKPRSLNDFITKGVYEVDENNNIVWAQEKPGIAKAKETWKISAGTYVITPETIRYIEKALREKKYDLCTREKGRNELDLVNVINYLILPDRYLVKGVEMDCEVIRIGNLDELTAAEEFFKTHKW